MQTLLTECVLPARAHAIPFRVLFQELIQRRESAVQAQVLQHCEVDGVTGWQTALDLALKQQERAYFDLQSADEAIQSGLRHTPLDPELAKCQAADKPLKKMLHGLETSALCLSGGGIRSASFGLGILEGLSRFSRKANGPGLMDGLDYLSTVSGGGYIGSWFMSWVYRRCHMGTKTWDCAYQEVISALAGVNHVSTDPEIPKPLPLTGGDPEPQPVRHLRSYTSYLAPALGASVDTATLIAIVLRNLLVNWLMLLPFLLALVSGARFLGEGLLWLQRRSVVCPQSLGTRPAMNIVILLSFFLAAVVAAFALPSHDGQRRSKPAETKDAGGEHAADATASGEGTREAATPLGSQTATTPKKPFEWRAYAGLVFVGCVLLGSALLAASRSSFCDKTLREFWIEAVIAMLGFAVLAASIAIAESDRVRAADEAMTHLRKASETAKTNPVLADNAVKHTRLPFALRVTGISLAALAAAGLCAVLSSGLLLALRRKGYDFLLRGGNLDPFHTHAALPRLFVIAAIPAVIAILMATTTLLCALLGVFERDEDREWWARCGGLLLGFILFWIGGQTLVFYGASITHWAVPTISGLVLSGLSSWGGFSGATAAGTGGPTITTDTLGKVSGLLLKYKALLPAAGVLGVLLIGIGVVTLEDTLRNAATAYLLGHHQPDVPAWLFDVGTLCAHAARHHRNGVPVGGMFLLMGALAGLLNLAININLFSLQGMYRMRLMRAYLGASNVFRRPDPFTGFDPRDTPRIFQMPCAPGAPMHLVNCTLNLTGTKVTAWRQRKAEPFSFSPVACGGWRVGYVRTTEYGSRHNGPDVAAAMSISGSAFNPNMGYHSSPILSVLMTFFNVRLGVWLPNPKWPALERWTAEKNEHRIERFIGRPGPLFALWPLVQELLGLADDNRAFIELTDGGHFENLGLYEMVLRRVKNIIVVDAGADAGYDFEDLGNAIRKIGIDLGVPITFPSAMPMHPGMSATNAYCAVGTIDYGCVDQEPGCDGSEYAGKLVYIKPVLRGTEPADIYQYASTHTAFPHESTTNQFFNEAQFESYRHLGSVALDAIVENLAPGAVTRGTLECFFELARNGTCS